MAVHLAPVAHLASSLARTGPPPSSILSGVADPVPVLVPSSDRASLSLDLSTCASVLPSLLYLGIVPTYLFGLDVAQGAPLGLAGLGLLGPATAAGEPCPCDELELVFLTR